MNPTSFNDVLQAIEQLPADQQADLVEVVRRRLAEQGRNDIVEDVRIGRAEYHQSTLRPRSVDDIVGEIDP